MLLSGQGHHPGIQRRTSRSRSSMPSPSSIPANRSKLLTGISHRMGRPNPPSHRGRSRRKLHSLHRLQDPLKLRHLRVPL